MKLLLDQGLPLRLTLLIFLINTQDSTMDEVVKKVAALGLPGVILVVTMAVTGLTGAAAITAALAALGGPFGMLGGITVLGMD